MGKNQSTKDDEIDISQKIIRPKIRAYLAIKKAPPELIDAFKRGYCNALPALVFFGLYLQTEYQGMKHLPKMDDWRWLKKTLIKLARWDGKKRSLHKRDRANIDRLISHMEFIQHVSRYLNVAQGDLHQILEDTKNRKLQLEYTLAGLFNADDFSKTIHIEKNGKNIATNLLTELLQYDRRMILVSRGKHTLGLFKHEDRVYFINANHSACVQTFSFKDPIPLIITALFTAYHAKPERHIPLGFKIFTFDKSPSVYVSQKLLLKAVNGPNTAPRKTQRNGQHSALYIAARIGCTESLRYYLGNGANVDNQTLAKHTPLYIAARKGHTSAVEMLMAAGAQVNKVCRDGRTPLTVAAQKGRLQALKCMIENDKKITLADFIEVLFQIERIEQRQQLINMIKTPYYAANNGALLFSHPKVKEAKELEAEVKLLYN